MTPDEAIVHLRRLTFLAEEGWPETVDWPDGFDAGRARQIARTCVTALDHVQEDEPCRRCRIILDRIAGR